MLPSSRIAIASFVVCILMISAVPGESVAIPYKIEGYLNDGEGLPITLANISITGEVYDIGVQDMVSQTWYRTTDAYGKYVIYLAANEPGGLFMNSTVTVSYRSGDDIVSRDVTISGLSVWANLTYKESLGLGDYLMSPIGILIIVILIVAVMIGFYISKSESPEEVKDSEQSKRVEKRRRRN
jgi:hypothetical protein